MNKRLTIIGGIFVAAISLWIIRRRLSRRGRANTDAKKESEGASPTSADAAACVHLPIVVNSTTLPAGVTMGPPLLYPPRHAIIPLILCPTSAPPVTIIEDVFLCVEELLDGLKVQSPQADEHINEDALTEFFKRYITDACPFLSQKAGNCHITPCCNVSGIFTHIAVGDDFAARLCHHQASSIGSPVSFVTSLVFVGAFGGDLALATSEMISSSSSTWEHVASQCISHNTSFVSRRATDLQSSTRLRASVRGPQEVRADGASKTSPEMMCEVDGIAHHSIVGIQRHATEPQRTILLVEDRVTGSRIETELTATTSICEAASTDKDTTAGVPLASDSSTNSTTTVSLTLCSAPLGISFSIPEGCDVDNVAFESHPTLRCVWNAGSLDTTAAVTVQRRVAPSDWEQAQCAEAASDAFSELMIHNILFLMTPWETRPSRPRITETDVSGRRAWVFQEEIDGDRCRTYVCPKLKTVPVTRPQQPSSSSSAAMKKEDGATTTIVEELLVIRWEAPAHVWDTYLLTLRNLLDTITFSE